jgi:tRNA pseudouridine55 synthase
MHGLLLVDKPAGMTSHDVVRQVRRICRTRKVGHAGTLDPLATGVLPVAVGDGTKILQFLLAEDKSYRATFCLGTTTDTLDADGVVLQRRDVPGDAGERIASVCAQFRGLIEQVPPMYSALKKNGVPLYKLARKGETVEREPRQVRIDRLELLPSELPEVSIEVDCSKGTYIRSLVADIGEALGCGAHLTALRRLRSGQFDISRCISLADLPNAIEDPDCDALLNLDEALGHLPAVAVLPAGAGKLNDGVPPGLETVSAAVELQPGELVRLRVAQRLAAVARFAPQRLVEKRGDFELVRVFPGQ